MSVMIAMTLMSANQNSSSPNALTLGRLSRNSSATRPTAGIHDGVSGHQYWMYLAMAVVSAIAVAIQQNQYV